MMQPDTHAAPAKDVTDMPRAPLQPAPRQYGTFVPNLLMVLALVGWLGFQAFQQVGEHRKLAALEASLAPQEQAAQKVRASLEAVATATAKLAGDGNANAQVVVDQLKKRGVTIDPSAPPKPR